ncbi:uncharacterized protein METZ01_LOCUS238482, partial [marine metagenome]
MEVMLANAPFTHDVSSWDISNVSYMDLMFGSSNDLSDEVECALQAAFQSNDAWPYVWCVDCAGVPAGDAADDSCGVCSGGTSGHEVDSDQDCNGECFGGATIDDCDDCVDPDDFNGAQDCTGVCDGPGALDGNDACCASGTLD